MNLPEFDLPTFLAMAPGDTERLVRLAEAYERSTRGSLEKLALAVEQGNLAQARDVGHKLKSGSNWFGALALGALGDQLESLPDNVTMDSVRALQFAAESSLATVLGKVTDTIAALRKS